MSDTSEVGEGTEWEGVEVDVTSDRTLTGYSGQEVFMGGASNGEWVGVEDGVWRGGGGGQVME